MNPKWVTGGQVYPQIAERIRQRISEGLYRAGSYLPSEAVLSAEFRVARNTLRRALALLENERLIATIATKGRIVLGRDAPGFNLEREVAYVSIAADLREQITRGELAAGGRLPGELVLARRYGASRNTVRQALSLLVAEGLIVVIRGKGRFVRSTASPGG